MSGVQELELYKKKGLWCFDDPKAGLKAEPFVPNATQALDLVAQGKGLNLSARLKLQFSERPFSQGCEFVTKVAPHGTGTLYNWGTKDHDLWLCANLLKYFKSPPGRIFFRVESGADEQPRPKKPTNKRDLPIRENKERPQ